MQLPSKIETENLKFRTDFRDIIMDNWSVTQYMIILRGRFNQIAQKGLNQKLKFVQSMQNNLFTQPPRGDQAGSAHTAKGAGPACLYMAFKRCISFATNLAANFGCYQFRIMPEIVSKLLHIAIWSGCAVWLESKQTPFSWTGHSVTECPAQLCPVEQLSEVLAVTSRTGQAQPACMQHT